MSTKHYQRPTDVWSGEVGLANRAKYQTDSNSSPKVKISSEKVDGDLNYVIDGLNELFDTAISGTLPDGSVTNPKFASGPIGAIKIYDATGAISDVSPSTTVGLPLTSNGVGIMPGYQPIGSAGLAIGAVTNDRLATDSVSSDKIQAASVLLSKMDNLAASTIIGRDSTGTGVPQAITLGANLSMSSAGVLSAASAASGVTNVNVQTFTSSGTWTKPANALITIIEVQAAGGGGGCAHKSAAGSATATPGAGGGFGRKTVLSSTLGASVVIMVGTGGAAGTGSTGQNGSAGGGSSFGTLVVATGGAGGLFNSAGDAAGGTCTGADFSVPGKDARNLLFTATSNSTDLPANGGDSFLGRGGYGGMGLITPSSSSGFGAGGSAGVRISNVGASGVSGTNGIVIVTTLLSV